ncbi:MAG: acyl-CoA dehydrogenase family protein [Mycobacterium sp.]
MNTEMPQHIAEFADVALARLTRIGGPQAALAAETDEQIREQAGEALSELGATELDVRSGGDDLLAAAALCRVAGTVALPYPVVEELLAISGVRLALVDPKAPRIDHGELPGDWLAADIDLCSYDVELGESHRGKLGPFLAAATLRQRPSPVLRADVDLHLVLGSWRVLGGIERALHIAREHVTSRTQFGRPLAEFQAVRFAVADAAVAVAGLDELAKYTLSRLTAVPDGVRSADALMLRLAAVDTARHVLRTAHQLLGALGFCDESDVSVIDRHLQPLLRLPLSGELLAVRLAERIAAGHVETPFWESA